MYKVKLQSFEGPFDLLVYLIENAEMSIYDIRISEITTQYMDYIREMQEHDIQVAQEFMVLAASLIEIKSRMILPRITEEGEDAVLEDPRTELVRRLSEYKRFKELSEMLRLREERMSRIFEKPKEDISEYTDNPDEYLSLDIKSFAFAFELFIRKKQKIEAVRRHYTRIEMERSSMESRIVMILKSVRERLGEKISFREFVADKKDKYDIVVTFASLLEMAKERVVTVDQKRTFGNIEISSGENIEKDDILKKYAPEEYAKEGESEQ